MSDAALFPIFLKLDGKPCLVVGAGRIAQGKIAGLLESGARVHVVAPIATAQVQAWSEAGTISWEARPFETSDLDDTFLVVAATASPEANNAIYADAQRRRILCNVVDVPDLCDFYYAAVVRRGKLQVAISTAGESPTLAQRLRKEIEQHIPEEYAAWLDKVGRERRTLLRKEPDPSRHLEQLRALSSRAEFDSFISRTSRVRKESL